MTVNGFDLSRNRRKSPQTSLKSVLHVTEMELIRKKFVLSGWEEFCGKKNRGVSKHSVKANMQPSQQQCANLELALKAALKLSPSSTSSSTMNGRQDPLSRRWPCFGLIEWVTATPS